MEKHEEIRKYLERLILDDNKKLPSVRELMRMFSSSQSPVVRAIRDLCDSGLVVSKPGIGLMRMAHQNCNANSFEEVPETSSRCRILFLYVDYFSENLWRSVHGIEAYCLQKNIELIEQKILQYTDLHSLLKKSLKQYKNLDGVLLISGADRLGEKTISLLGECRIPVVLFLNSFQYLDMPENFTLLSYDKKRGALKTASLMLSKGYQRLVLVRNEPKTDSQDFMFNIFLNAVQSQGGTCQVLSSSVHSWENSFDSALSIMQQNIHLFEENKFDCALAESATGALAILRELNRIGKKIPEDIGLFSFSSDLPSISYVFPSITSWKTEPLQMVVDAVETIRNKQNGKEILYPYNLVMRESLK